MSQELYNQQQNPYQLIKRLRELIQTQKDRISEEEQINSQLQKQKNIALQELRLLKSQLASFHQQQSSSPKLSSTVSSCGFKRQEKSLRLLLNQTLVAKKLTGSNLILAQTNFHIQVTNPAPKVKEFIPPQIRFSGKRKTTFYNSSSLNQTVFQNSHNNFGEYFVQDFMIVGPDFNEIKKIKDQSKEKQGKQGLVIKKFVWTNFNESYSSKQKAAYLHEIAERVFPMGVTAKLKKVKKLNQFREQLVRSFSGSLTQEFFIVNLKGDFEGDDTKESMRKINPIMSLFAICLKVPQFIPIKHNQIKFNQQVWMTEKVYVVLTYYPVMPVMLKLLAVAHSILQPAYHRLSIEDIFTKNWIKNLDEAQRNQAFLRLLGNFTKKRMQFGQSLQFEKTFFGIVPEQKEARHHLARFTSSIFFSVFAYEQMLLLLTALFLDKTIIFTSKSQSAASWCTLFLATCIYPFIYHQPLLTNCDSSKIDNIVFSSPVNLMASIKKNDDFLNILNLFIQNNNSCFRGFQNKGTGLLILVDIDSNSIIYDSELNKLFETIMADPSPELRRAYEAINLALSRSFTFPKKMPAQLASKAKSQYEKTQEQKKKAVKQYQQKIENNMTKWPLWNCNNHSLEVYEILSKYIQSFAIESKYHQQVIAIDREERRAWAKSHLLQKHPDKTRLIQRIVENQLYAEYLNQLDNMVNQ